MGGSSGGTQLSVVQPTPPPQPSTAEAIRQYVDSLPQLYEAQMKYAPLEAQQQVTLAQQYAVPLARAYQSAQETLYPGTSALQESLVNTANQGMSENIPTSLAEQYRSDLNAQLGTNVNSGIGADYVSRNLLNQRMQYKQYYENLGLSLAGRQPLVTPQTPGYTNQLGNYQPGQALQYTASNYGTFAGAGRPIAGTTGGGTPNWALAMNSAGNLLQGISGSGKGFMGLS